MLAPALALHRRARSAFACRLPATKTRRPVPPPAAPTAWRSATELACSYAAAAHGAAAATLPQLRTICQLLTSTTVRESERSTAVSALRAGLSKAEASRWLSFLLPAVQARRESRNRASLVAPLLAAAA